MYILLALWKVMQVRGFRATTLCLITNAIEKKIKILAPRHSSKVIYYLAKFNTELPEWQQVLLETQLPAEWTLWMIPYPIHNTCPAKYMAAVGRRGIGHG